MNIQIIQSGSRTNCLLIALLVLPMIFASCSQGDCPLQAGPADSEIRSLAPFNEIILNDKVNLILTQDTIQQVQVAGGKNLLPGIQTIVANNVLTISDNNVCNVLRNPSDVVNVYVSSAKLQQVTYYGAGNVTSTNTLLAPVFTVDSWTGAGTITLSIQASQIVALVRNENATVVLSGSADSSYIYCGDAGAVNMLNCPTGKVSIGSKSIRDIYVNVVNSLQADIAYNGNVYYSGSPSTIDSLTTSAGRLIHIP